MCKFQGFYLKFPKYGDNMSILQKIPEPKLKFPDIFPVFPVCPCFPTVSSTPSDGEMLFSQCVIATTLAVFMCTTGFAYTNPAITIQLHTSISPCYHYQSRVKYDHSFHAPMHTPRSIYWCRIRINSSVLTGAIVLSIG